MENKELKQEKEDSQLLAELLLAKLEDEKMENLFKCDQCENSFTEDRMTTTGGDEIYCQKCWLEKGEEEENELSDLLSHLVVLQAKIEKKKNERRFK
jgi:uncharacterized paraquat-inducible protein A